MSNTSSFATLLGRILMAAIFLWAGYGKIGALEGTIARITNAGMPMASLFAYAAIAFEIGMGLVLIVGFKTRCAALLLAVFSLATAVLFHNYWAVPAAQTINQQVHFMKNIAMIGGFLFIFAHGGGRWSLDGLRGQA